MSRKEEGKGLANIKHEEDQFENFKNMLKRPKLITLTTLGQAERQYLGKQKWKEKTNIRILVCSVGKGCRINRLHHCQGVTPSPNECLGYDPKQSDSEVPVMLKLWWMWSTPSLPPLPGPVVVAVWLGPIYESNKTKLCTYAKLNFLK